MAGMGDARVARQEFRAAFGLAIAFLALVALERDPWGERATSPLAASGLASASDTLPDAVLPGRGRILIADDRLRGGWAETVILLVDHGPDGAMGIIVNRRSRVKLAEVLPSRRDVKRRGDELWVGGPVQPTRLMVLARAPERLVDGVPVFGEVQLISTTRGLARAFGKGIPPAAVRVYAGYAGWAPGQLEEEIARGDWQVVDGQVSTVFSKDPDKLWESLRSEDRGRWVRGPARIPPA